MYNEGHDVESAEDRADEHVRRGGSLAGLPPRAIVLHGVVGKMAPKLMGAARAMPSNAENR